MGKEVGRILKLKRNMVFIMVIAIILTACTPQRSNSKNILAKKSEDVDIQEIREFLIKADNLVFDELSDEEAMDFLQERGEDGNTEIIAVEDHSIIYSFMDSWKVSERSKNILNALGKYYENEGERIAQLRRVGIIYLDGKVGNAPIVYGGSKDFIEEESDIKILKVITDEYENNIITCSVEKKGEFYREDMLCSNFYTYKLRRFKNGDYLIMYDGSLNNWGRVTPSIPGHFAKVEGKTYFQGHSPKSLTDGNITTNWIGNSETHGLGETLTFNFHKPVMLQSIAIVNGTIGSIKNDRLTKVEIELSDGEKIIKNVKYSDVGKIDLIDLSGFETTEYVKLTVLGIEESDENNPVGISDVYFFSNGVLYD